MPGPFPGMDPYLEDPGIWPGMHHDLISQISANINAELPDGYVARIQERCYIMQPDEMNEITYPDVAILAKSPPRVIRPGGVALLDDTPRIITVEPEEVTEAYIEIWPVRGEKRVITVIELLSYANKTTRNTGRRKYLSKQRQIMASQSHLLEIDLLRHGAYSLAPPQERVREMGSWDYIVSLHRHNRPNQFELWPRTVRDRLPNVRVPLAKGDPDVILDLQSALDRAYDAERYEKDVNYATDPYHPLRKADAIWAEALLREKGLR